MTQGLLKGSKGRPGRGGSARLPELGTRPVPAPGRAAGGLFSHGLFLACSRSHGHTARLPAPLETGCLRTPRPRRPQPGLLPACPRDTPHRPSPALPAPEAQNWKSVTWTEEHLKLYLFIASCLKTNVEKKSLVIHTKTELMGDKS